MSRMSKDWTGDHRTDDSSDTRKGTEASGSRRVAEQTSTSHGARRDDTSNTKQAPDCASAPASGHAPTRRRHDRRTDSVAAGAPQAQEGNDHQHPPRVRRNTRVADPADSAAEGERWFGTHQAAQFLSVHRSTVHLAIARNNLTPDYITPGGHYRFKTSTLEAFRETLRTESATSITRATEPVRVFGTIAHELMVTGDLKTICTETLEGIRRAEPDIDLATVLRLHQDYQAEDGTTVHARIEGLAESGFPATARAEFLRMRQQGMDMISMRTLLAGKPHIFEDVEQQSLPYASRLIVASAGIRSFAVLPIVGLDRTYGALVVGSKKPRVITPAVQAYLDTITRQLALTLHSDEFLTISRDLMSLAVKLRARAPSAGAAQGSPQTREEAVRQRLSALTSLFTRFTGAERTWGYNLRGVPEPDGEMPLAELGCRLCQKAHTPSDAIGFTVDGQLHTALATSFEMSPARHGVVGAVWQGCHSASSSDYSLLMTYGASCLIAASPDEHGPGATTGKRA